MARKNYQVYSTEGEQIGVLLSEGVMYKLILKSGYTQNSIAILYTENRATGELLQYNEELSDNATFTLQGTHLVVRSN